MKNHSICSLLVVLTAVLFSCSSKSTMVESAAGTLTSVSVPSTAHFRGIQSISEELVWLSGTSGTVLKTTNGGKKWNDVTVPECENLDFRDIYALNENEAWVMSSGNGVKIFHTVNGGKKWELQFEDTNPKVFFDGIDFSDSQNGVAYGDPIEGVMDVLITSDGGQNWKRVSKESLPVAWEEEAGFAASGTGVVFRGNTIWIATGGGEISRILKSTDKGVTWKAYRTSILGGSGAGIFSMAFKDELNGVVVGGDYVDSTRVNYNCAFTMNGGESWELVEQNGPRGYRSCVAITDEGEAIACGRTGIDKSMDFKSWTPVSDEGYFTCDAVGSYVWFAGRSGKVAKMKLK